MIYLLSSISNFSFYYIEWHYISTPIGILHGIVDSSTQINELFEYLLSTNTSWEYSLEELLFSGVLFFISLLYLGYNYFSRGDMKC